MVHAAIGARKFFLLHAKQVSVHETLLLFALSASYSSTMASLVIQDKLRAWNAEH